MRMRYVRKKWVAVGGKVKAALMARWGSPAGLARLITFVSLAILLSFSLNAYLQARDGKRKMTAEMDIVLTSGLIEHLERTAVMSARMGALTGAHYWEQRYRNAASELTAALKSAASGHYYNETAIAQSTAAHVRILEMCDQAFDLVHQGRLKEAEAIVFGAEINEQVALYASGVPAQCCPAEDVVRLVELYNTIVSLDEVLTMSAHMSAFTGEAKWREEYSQAEPRLGAAIDEALAMVSTPEAQRRRPCAPSVWRIG